MRSSVSRVAGDKAQAERGGWSRGRKWKQERCLYLVSRIGMKKIQHRTFPTLTEEDVKLSDTRGKMYIKLYSHKTDMRNVIKKQIFGNGEEWALHVISSMIDRLNL